MAEEYSSERNFDAGNDAHGSLSRVGDRGERVDRAHLERQFGAADSRQLGGKDKQVGAGRQWRKGEAQSEWQLDVVGRLAGLADLHHLVFEVDQRSRIHFERNVHIEWPITRPIRMEIDLPGLAVCIGLDEVTFVVNMEAVFGYMVLEVGDEALEIDHCHWPNPATDPGRNVARMRADASPAWFTAPVTADEIRALLHEAADRVVDAFAGDIDWGPSGRRSDQYASDVVADEAVLAVLTAAGVRVLSEESGLGDGDGPIAVVDPLDGSTNASLGLPWFATSLCVVDDDGPWVAVVHNHGNGERYDAIRDGGARRDGSALAPPVVDSGTRGVTVVNGLPPGPEIGWFRCMGASALDLCAVADGRFTGYVDFDGGLGVWDYLGALLICREVGVEMVDAEGRELVVLDHKARRSPIAAVPEKLDRLRQLRTGEATAQ